MKKGLLTSIICFSSLVFSSCGSKYVKVSVLECEHCSFENKTKARVGQDFVIQAYPERGYYLERSADLLEIRVGKDKVKLLENGFDYDESINQLTIHKDFTTFGDITIKGMAYPKTNNITFHVDKNKYDNVSESDVHEVTVENDFIINLKCDNAVEVTKDNIKVSNSDIKFEYNSSTYDLKIAKEYCFTDFEITLP